MYDGGRGLGYLGLALPFTGVATAHRKNEQNLQVKENKGIIINT